MNGTVCTRFAPSPTGLLHIGGLRTALFNWLFARANNGKFVLRIEDTDRARLHPGGQAYIQESLRWLGLDYDELFVQSERKDIYREYIERLLRDGAAYWCDCSHTRLQELRTRQKLNKLPPRYDGKCRKLDLETGAVVRMRVPDADSVKFADMVFGNLSFELPLLDDFVVLKADGMPTYHFAHAVDDNLMGVTHVIRGEEWISSVPKHILIHNFLNLPLPEYAHVPLLLGKDKSKLSKRHGDFGVLTYRERGFEADAVFNFLALLGWSPKDERELLSRQAITAAFGLDGIQRHPAVLDEAKLKWVNRHYLRTMPAHDLAGLLRQNLLERRPDLESAADLEYITKLVPLIAERLDTVSDIVEHFVFFFTDTVDLDLELLTKRGGGGELAVALERAAEFCELLEPFDATKLESGLRQLATDLEIKTGTLFFPIRVAITGSAVAPPLFETMAAVGRKRCIERIRSAMDMLETIQ